MEPATTSVQAHVVLKRPADDSSSTRVKPPAPEIREEARRQLKELGFTVVRVSPLSILVEAPREKFEAVFHALTEQRGTDFQKQWPKTYSVWNEEPKIPASLQRTVENIVLPQPVQLH